MPDEFAPRLRKFDLVGASRAFHARKPDDIRFGQWIWNNYKNRPDYTGSWPELFYEKNYIEAFGLISEELHKHYDLYTEEE